MNAVGDAKVEKAKGASSETDFAKKRRFAAELFERGFGYKKTSAILELSENTVKDWAKAYKRGCLQRSLHDTSVRYSPDVREKPQNFGPKECPGGKSVRRRAQVSVPAASGAIPYSKRKNRRSPQIDSVGERGALQTDQSEKRLFPRRAEKAVLCAQKPDAEAMHRVAFTAYDVRTVLILCKF